MYQLVSALASPFPILVFLLICCWLTLWWSRKLIRKRYLLLTVTVMLLLLNSSQWIAYFAAHLLEQNYTELETLPADVDAIVVLGGGAAPPGPLKQKSTPSISTLSRCYHAVELYRRIDGCPIMVSGGKPDPDQPGQSEAEVMRDCLITMGVDLNDIQMEQQSRDTYENAVQIQKLLAEQKSIRRILLVTDAVHMSRALKCFRDARFEITPSAAYYHANGLRIKPDTFVPSVGAMDTNHAVAHELIGSLWYWWRGKI